MTKLTKRERIHQEQMVEKDENFVKEFFRNLDFNVIKLDINTSSRKPDYEISSKNIRMYFEVKSFFEIQQLFRQNYLQNIILDNFKPKIKLGCEIKDAGNLIVFRPDIFQKS